MEKEFKRKKSPSKNLIVFIKNKKVEGKNATDIFVNAIKKIGPNKIVEQTNYRVDKLPLIVQKKDDRKQMNSLGKQGFVCTHLSTIAKKRLLERIGQSLNIKIKVQTDEFAKN